MAEIKLVKFSDLTGYAKTIDLKPYAKTVDLKPYAKTTDLAEYIQKDGAKVLSDKNYTAGEKTKLEGIEAGANKYSLPSTLPASMITGLPTQYSKLSQLTNDKNFIDETYDNSESELTATTIKGAIDELKGLIDALSAE